MIGSVIAGLIGQGANNAAAAGARGASQQAYADAQHQMDVNTSNASPYTNLGLSATSKIGALLGFGRMYGEGGSGGQFRFDPTNAAQDQTNALSDFYTSPGYQWRLGQGISALDRSAAAKGRLLSGGQTKAVQEYGQGLASAEYQNWLDQYWKAAGMGQQATGALSGTNSGLTQYGGNALMGGAQAAGNYTVAGAHDLASGIGQGINNMLTAYGLTRLGSGGGGASIYPVSNSPASAVAPRGGVWRSV